jgi:superfamily II DNA or RNA helicase
MKGSQASQKDCFKRAHAYLNRVEKKGREFDFSKTISDIHQTFFLIEGQTGLAESIDHSLLQSEFQNYLIYFMSCLTWYWQGEKLSSQDEGELFTLMERAEESCYFWIAREAASLLLHFSSSNRYSEAFERFSKLCSPSVSLVDLIEPQSKWRKVLEALIGLDKKLPSVKKIAQPLKTRLVWDIEIFDEHNKYPLSDYYGDIYDYSDKLSITPREQKCGKNGQWSKGRNISLKTMMDKYHELDFITDQDRLLCRAIIKKKESHGYYSKRRRKEVYTFDFKKAVEALIGHPLLYATDNPSLRIEFVKKEPQLHVNQIEDGFSIYVVPEMDTGEPFLIEKETMTRFGVVFMTPELIETINILQSGVVVPASGKELVLKAVASIAPRLSVHTNVAGMAPGVKEVEADSRPYFNLVPYGEGLKGEILTKPFPDGGSFHRPGKGGKIVVTEINDLKVQAHRDLSLEESRAADVINKCPLLAHYDDEEDEWLITDPEDCLELLSELRELKDEVVVQWPKGEKIKVTGEVGGSAFTMRIQKDINWFAATGELKIDDKTVINLKQLLELSRKTYSRFMKMDDGTYLTLTKAFKKKLEEFDTFSVDHKDGVRFNPLASLALEGFTADLGKIMGDQHWKAHQKKFAEPKPVKVPNTLRATLRDYQVEGFQWLARLSHWEVGACLADDMGIGKTVQTLAAILLRASDGPTLVVAPTSVIMNWEDEANRFAPTLRVLCFHGGNRQELLSELKPFDLVVTSYGLLNSESEKLSAVKWQTVVLDEAQAIKNMATKRSKAAMELDARFRIVTTGTPIENHLGELWNLFQFINPGFLGSPENFNQVFASPIEKFRDVKAHGRLKKLIRPFILRRLKQDVLTELPPRTEITLHVEMSEAEAALYEAQRQYSLEKIEEAQGSEEGGNMQVLAELTRLRRFCCNPDLVVPNSGVGSSKLKMFGEIVGELLDNGHKALVFSQFVGHLTILREFLDDRKISCQYLDGSTSLNQRQQRIRDFQSGQGDIFLISLKAGGSGLNLTAADYVIHMDPWWNPAVEDQASDRAHRIGQLRPVTIYRLVVKDTIEEKILKLHGKKRDLATNLLEGSEMSGKISTKELLDLIKG